MNDKKRKESLTKFKNFLSDYSVCLILLLCAISVFILAAAIAPHTISVDDESKISSTAANEKDVETETQAESEPKSESEEEAKTSADENINFKVIKDYNGRLAVFTADGELERITNISTSLLPEFDKEQISNGIKVNSETELISILEGLDS